MFDTIYHEHLSYFSLTPPEYLFNKHRLKVVDVETVDTKGGSIRCYIEHDIGQDVSESILEMRSNEKKLYSLDVFNDFAFNIEKQKDKCKAFLEKNNSTKNKPTVKQKNDEKKNFFSFFPLLPQKSIPLSFFISFIKS